MGDVVVVGSGAAGVHYALSALERGYRVTLLDVGYERPAPVAPEATFLELRERLADPLGYFLGEDGAGVVYPGAGASYYGLPPSKGYVFRIPDDHRTESHGITPSQSFARGGLAEAWTAGSYTWDDHDLADAPIGYDDLRPFYAEVAERVGVGGVEDDLAEFIPFDAPYLPPLEPDPHSALLLRRYATRREQLHRRHGFYMGRSRVATLSRPHRGRHACARLGRCLWGCPNEALYSPLFTLRECRAHPSFDYRPGVLVTHVEFDDEGRATAVVGRGIDDGENVRVPAQRVVLAAGALGSTRIVLESRFRRSGRAETARGLMDNRQVHVPFLTWSRMGAEVDTAAYQFHHLAFGIRRPDPMDYVHGQITTLRAAALHPIVQNLPLDTPSALAVFRRLRGGLAVANVNLRDTRRAESTATLRPGSAGAPGELVLDYVSAPDEAEAAERAVADLKRALRRLGCWVPPGMTRTLPKGTSVHYAGTLPMTERPEPLGTDADGRLWEHPNLFVVDGAVLPALPAKNHTFTLMANAARVAARTLPER
jgi:choline dehydrogenase-like flavoprotein